MGSENYRVERLDPVLRELIAHGLVTRSEGSWQLADALQRRLEEVAPSVRPVDLEKVVYLDHHCARCLERKLTRMYEGQYVCDGCLERGDSALRQAEPEVPPQNRRRHLRREREQEQEVGPLAG